MSKTHPVRGHNNMWRKPPISNSRWIANPCQNMCCQIRTHMYATLCICNPSQLADAFCITFFPEPLPLYLCPKKPLQGTQGPHGAVGTDDAEHHKPDALPENLSAVPSWKSKVAIAHWCDIQLYGIVALQVMK